MRRTGRLIIILVTLGLLVAALPAAASAQVEDWQRVARSRHASAVFVQVDGCDQVEIYISATDGKFVNRHGAVNKQGLLGVLYIVRDACAEPGPKGLPITYSADGMTLDVLRSTPQFDAAWIAARVPATDWDGDAVSLRVDLQWRPLADFERSKVNGHGWFPAGEKHGARVNTWSHGMWAPAVAWGSIWVDGRAVTVEPTQEATLEQVRYACKVIQHPRGGADVAC